VVIPFFLAEDWSWYFRVYMGICGGLWICAYTVSRRRRARRTTRFSSRDAGASGTTSTERQGE
jgi:hypothetical protein